MGKQTTSADREPNFPARLQAHHVTLSTYRQRTYSESHSRITYYRSLALRPHQHHTGILKILPRTTRTSRNTATAPQPKTAGRLENRSPAVYEYPQPQKSTHLSLLEKFHETAERHFSTSGYALPLL